MSAKRFAMLAAAGLLATSAQAAVLFSDNFEAATPTVGTWAGGAYFSDTNGAFDRRADASQWFGSGNTLLYIADTLNSTTVNVSRDARFPTGVTTYQGTLSFDLYEPSPATGAGSWLRFTPFNGTKYLELTDGELTAGQVTPLAAGQEYSLGAAHHFDVMFNSATTATTLGAYTVPAQSIQVYIDGQRIGASPAAQLVANVALSAIRINTSTTGVNAEYSLDNVVVTDTFTVVPEPTILAGLGVAGAAGLLRRRSR